MLAGGFRGPTSLKVAYSIKHGTILLTRKAGVTLAGGRHGIPISRGELKVESCLRC